MSIKQSWKTFSLGLLAFFTTTSLFANRIDSLQTDADVVTFLRSINKDFNTGNFELRSTEALRQGQGCQDLAEKWQIRNWEKVDFNDDKLTDLLIMPFWYDYGVYVIMDKGNGSFETVTLSYNIFEKCELAKPVEVNGQKILQYYQGKANKNTTSDLVYKYGSFIEYNPEPRANPIDSVIFKTNYCLGSCPVFAISMDKKGNAVYEAGAYNPKMGKFTGVIRQETLDEILALINYMDPFKLKDEYKVSWKDDQTAWLRIRFADGSVKEIKDYGLKGNFALRQLYSKFFDLRSTQTWK